MSTPHVQPTLIKHILDKIIFINLEVGSEQNVLILFSIIIHF
jgi:hypothetical protein